MAHYRLPYFAVFHPRTARLRKRRDRPLRAIRPSRRNELWYRTALGHEVQRCREVGSWISQHLAPRWPAVHDAIDPHIPEILERAARRFGDIDRRARLMAQMAARRGLHAVDERLLAAIKRSVGVALTDTLTRYHPSPAGIPSIGEAMEAAVDANVALIESIPAQYLDEVGGIVREGFETGMRWESLVEKIRERGDVALNRARVIARDQTSKINASFNEVRQASAGITEYIWSGALDIRERPSHRRMEGVRCRWDSPPEVDGERVHPGQAVMCRCAALPLINLDYLHPPMGGMGGEQEQEQVAA